MNVKPTEYGSNNIQKYYKKYENLTKSDTLDTRKSQFNNIFKSDSQISKRASNSMEDISLKNPILIDTNYYICRSSKESLTSNSSVDEFFFPLNHNPLSPRKIEFNIIYRKINHKIYSIDEATENPEIISIQQNERNEPIKKIESNRCEKAPLSRKPIIKINVPLGEIETFRHSSQFSNSFIVKQKRTSSSSCISFRHIKSLFGCKTSNTKYIKIQ